MKTYNQSISEFQLTKKKTDFQKVKITSSKQASEFIRQFYGDDLGIYESVFLLLMNNASNTIGFVKISQGGINAAVCDPLLVAKYAIDSLAKQVILAHNHPSGNLTPSQADSNICKKIKEGLGLFEIRLMDNIILTEESYYSFADEGII